MEMGRNVRLRPRPCVRRISSSASHTPKNFFAARSSGDPDNRLDEKLARFYNDVSR
jgi:hypothetical protein